MSYKLGMTLEERLWEHLMLNPSTELRDLMSWIEMFAHLEDDINQLEKAVGITTKGKGPHKKQKESSVDY